MQRIFSLSLATLVLATPVLAQEAMGTFTNAAGDQVGSITLTQTDAGVSIQGDAMGLAEGEHGIHFHETGNCDPSTAFESAGGHFNPGGHQHGLENPEGPHEGDLPNLVANADGTATLDLTSDTISLTEGDEGYVFDEDGTALIVHAAADDQITDPSGNSGDRELCAVIEAPPAS